MDFSTFHFHSMCDIMLNAIMLTVVVLSVIMLNAIMLTVVVLGVIMLNVIMLSVAFFCFYAELHNACHYVSLC